MQNINTVVFALVQENGIHNAFILSGPAVSLSRCCNCYYTPQSSFTQHGFMLHGLNCRFQTVSLCHHLCLEEIMKPRVVSTGIISDVLKWELLMLLMDSFYIWALQLKACWEEFSPQLILCLVVRMTTFKMFSSQQALLIFTSPAKFKNPSTNCTIHVHILTHDARACVFLGSSSCNKLRTSSAACLGEGL